jgi:hypothetical protein
MDEAMREPITLDANGGVLSPEFIAVALCTAPETTEGECRTVEGDDLGPGSAPKASSVVFSEVPCAGRS